jgi:hypothetical protein
MLMLDLLLFFIYFGPSIVAALKDHPKAGTIFVLNLCFGWTGIAWAVLMFWAWSQGKPIDR